MKRLLLLPFFISLLPHAFADDREDRFMQLKQGTELRRAQQERNEADNTAIEFGAGEMQDGEDLALSLMKAVNAQNEEETVRLLDIYRRQDVYDPDIVLFAEANQAVFRDDLKAALAKYRKLYHQNPEFLRGRLDLARLLFIDKQNKESAALFDGIDIPEVPAVNEKIKVFADALKKRDAWSGSVSFGAGYDTNLNQSSGATVVRNQTSCGFDSNGQPILDDAGMLSCRNEQLDAYAPDALKNRMWVYEANLSRRISLNGHHGLQLGGYAWGRLYPGNKEYGEHNINVSPAYSFQSKDHSFSVGPQVQYEWSGGKLRDSSAGISTAYSRTFSDQASLGVQLDHKYDRYRGELKHFNGPQTLLFTTAIYALPKDWLIFGGYDYLRKNSREKVDSYRRHGLRAGVNKRFESGIDATFQAIWRKTAYQDYHAWLETRRHDFERTYQLDIKFDRPFLRGITPVFSIKHTDNKSSSWLNRYKRNEFLIKIEHRF